MHPFHVKSDLPPPLYFKRPVSPVFDKNFKWKFLIFVKLITITLEGQPRQNYNQKLEKH